MSVLLVINVTVDASRKADIAGGRYPRKDYWELQRALGADMIDLASLDEHRWTRLVRRFAGSSLAQGLLAWTLAGRYDAVFVDRESSGLVLAALNALRSRRPRLVMIGHFLSPPKKQLLFRALRLYNKIDALIVHSSLQMRLAVRSLGLHPDRVALLPYQTDELFWAPHSEVAPRNQICSAGLEHRDYETLVKAIEGIDVDVVIAAASHWSKHEGLSGDENLPPNVRVASYDYAGLRKLYAESLFVVVPLHDVENQSGITTILEAMAMGKAVIVSHARGQTDVVRDRRRTNRTDPTRATQPEWGRVLGADDATVRAHTGIYVAPGDVEELRRAIVFLLEHPEQARAMGAHGRRLVEETMGLDHFVARVAALLSDRIPTDKPDERRHATAGP